MLTDTSVNNWNGNQTNQGQVQVEPTSPSPPSTTTFNEQYNATIAPDSPVSGCSTPESSCGANAEVFNFNETRYPNYSNFDWSSRVVSPATTGTTTQPQSSSNFASFPTVVTPSPISVLEKKTSAALKRAAEVPTAPAASTQTSIALESSTFISQPSKKKGKSTFHTYVRVLRFPFSKLYFYRIF